MSLTQSNIPALVRIGAIKDDTLIEVETDILEPVVNTQKFCRFALDRKGLLSSNSKITLGLTATAENTFYSLNNGINSLIDRCVLKANNKTIAEIDSWNHFQAYQSMFIHNEQNYEREAQLTARTINHDFVYTNDPFSVDVSGVGAGRVSRNMAESYTWSNSIEPNVGATHEYTVESYLNNKNAPIFQIALSDFFPFLKTNQLPLFMMKDQLFIELHFAPELNSKAERCWVNDADTPSATGYALDLTKTRMVADYIYYPQQMMEQYAKVNANLQFNYVDYRLSEMSISPASAKDIIRNVGGAGRIVSKIVQGVQNLDVGSDKKALTGPYHAFAPQRATDGSTTSYLNANIKCNNEFLYPLDITNSARMFHTITSTEGKVPFVSRDEYNRQGGQLSASNIEGIKQSGDSAAEQLSGLQGHFFWQSFKLKPERVDGRGIEVYMKYLEDDGTEGFNTADSTLGYTHRVWLELVRYAKLNDGYMECGFV
tara:strand:- start:142 stop:1596 length:1455 start_codon:yes stop_codon:yes gene_type:complete